MSWPVTADGAFYIFEGRVLIPVDPSTGVAQLLLRPQGGLGVAIPAIAQGDPGVTPTLDTVINYTELAYNDVTPAGASWTQTSPNVYRLTLSAHSGAPGESDVVNEVQTVTITGTPTGGNFTLTFSGATTANIAYNAVASTVESALVALSTIGAGNVAVTGGPGPGTPYVVTFKNKLGGRDVATMTAAHTFTGGTTPTITVLVNTQGSGAFKVVNAADLTGTPAYKKIITVNATTDGFDYSTQRVGDRYFPASISNTPSGNATFTLCSVGIPALDFDWRPNVTGQCVVTGTAADVKVDLLARLNNQTSGNIVARSFAGGIYGISPPTHVLVPGPPAGSADTYDKITAGNAATIYFTAERQSGTGTFTTSNSTTSFQVRVCPIL
jgi:hypothetical protein